MTTTGFSDVLERRIVDRQFGWMDVRTQLRHFALINYAVPIDRLRPHIPEERFEIVPFEIGNSSFVNFVFPYPTTATFFNQIPPKML